MLKFLLFLGVGIGILYFVYQNQEASYQKECAFKLEYDCEGKCAHGSLLSKLMSDFASTNIFWLLMVCIAFMISNFSRSFRWILLIRQLDGGKYNPKWYNAFFTTMIGYFVNLAIPRAGEIARPATLSRYEKLPLDKLIGTIVTDRIMDVLMLLLVVSLTLVFQFQNIVNFLEGKTAEPPKCNISLPLTQVENSLPIGMILIVLIGLGFLILGLLILFRKRLMKLSIYQKLESVFLNFAEGFKTVFSLRKKDLLLFTFHTLVIWFMYFLMTYFCFFAFEPTDNLGLTAALLVFVFGSFGVLVPSPGGMGTHQIATTAALVIWGINKADAFSFANILFFTTNLFCIVIFGILSYIMLPILNSKKQDLPS